MNFVLLGGIRRTVLALSFPLRRMRYSRKCYPISACGSSEWQDGKTPRLDFD
jgi:hypothetical protein